LGFLLREIASAAKSLLAIRFFCFPRLKAGTLPRTQLPDLQPAPGAKPSSAAAFSFPCFISKILYCVRHRKGCSLQHENHQRGMWQISQCQNHVSQSGAEPHSRPSPRRDPPSPGPLPRLLVKTYFSCAAFSGTLVEEFPTH